MDESVWPPARVRLPGLTVTAIVGNCAVPFRFTVPVNPLTLEMLRTDVTLEPALTVRKFGFAVNTKSGIVLVETTAPRADSTSGPVIGAAIVMQMPPATLVFEHPDWNPRAVPGVGLVTL